MGRPLTGGLALPPNAVAFKDTCAYVTLGSRYPARVNTPVSLERHRDRWRILRVVSFMSYPTSSYCLEATVWELERGYLALAMYMYMYITSPVQVFAQE